MLSCNDLVRRLRWFASSLACSGLLVTPAVGQTFVDVTAAAGINHTQMTAATAAGLSGEAFMTGGVAAGDFDGDGRADLIFTRMDQPDILYRNAGDGTFEPRTATAGFVSNTFTNGVVSGDIDNDGDLDLYMTTTGDDRNHLYLNDGAGFFTDVGEQPVAALSNGVARFGQGASFGDIDRDGYLDLTTSAWGAVTALDQSRLFRNLGGATPGEFEDVTVASGIDVYRKDKSFRFAPRLVDLDRDGHLDYVVASDFETSQLFWSNGDGTFTDGTLPAGVGTDFNGMGSTFGDYDGDGDLDWFITNITNSPDNPGAHGGFNRLYRNDGNRTFTDVTFQAGVRDSRWAWGASFFDYDNDGDLDLAATNGWNGTGWVDDRTHLWRNDDGVFTEVSLAEGVTDIQQGRGLAHLDYDNDGDLDFVVVNNEAAPILYRNEGNGNHYLRVSVEGTISNRDGVGAWIEVTPDLNNPTERLVWEVDGGSSFLSQNERTAHFGLGDSTDPVDLVEIHWPSGVVQRIQDISIDKTLHVVEFTPATLGDYNGDGVVDAADYTVWRDHAGTTDAARWSPGDGDGDGAIDHTDRQVWLDHYGTVLGGLPATSHSTPEPAGAALVAAALLLGAMRASRRAVS